MKLIGITGGIGMGKSTAGDLLRKRGFGVIDTDDLAHSLVEPGQPALQQIAESFGPGILDQQGKLARKELAKVVFSAPEQRQKLESILHPRIRDAWQAEVRRWRERNETFGFVLIPLLFETGAASEFDAIICLACSDRTQQNRLANRGWTAEQTGQRLAAQWPLQKKIDASHFVVWTDTSLEVHAAQLDRILQMSSER